MEQLVEIGDEAFSMMDKIVVMLGGDLFERKPDEVKWEFMCLAKTEICAERFRTSLPGDLLDHIVITPAGCAIIVALKEESCNAQ
jgi:hypothetical protein